MSKLAVLITAYNEEDVLPRAIKSAQDIGEVHVSIDQNTTDRTAQVAQQMGATVHYHQGLPAEPPEQDHFRARFALNSYGRFRNETFINIEEASDAEWIMWLDADEFIEGGHQELLDLLDEVPEKTTAILVRMNLYLRRDDDTVELESVMRNSKVLRRGTRFTRRRHEHIILAPGDEQLMFDPMAIGHLPTPDKAVRKEHNIRKVNRKGFYDDWEQFQDGRAAFYIADWWRMNGHMLEALRWWDKGLEIPQERCQAAQRAQIAIYAGKAYIQHGEADRARECLFEALSNDWHYGEAFYYLGVLSNNQQSHQEAEMWFNLALQYPDEPSSIMQQQQGATADMPLFGLMMVAMNQRNFAEAKQYLKQARDMYDGVRAEYKAIAEKLDRTCEHCGEQFKSARGVKQHQKHCEAA